MNSSRAACFLAVGFLLLAGGADGTTRTTTLNYVADGASAGYLQSVTGPLGLTVSYQQDANGRVTQLTHPD